MISGRGWTAPRGELGTNWAGVSSRAGKRWLVGDFGLELGRHGVGGVVGLLMVLLLGDLPKVAIVVVGLASTLRRMALLGHSLGSLACLGRSADDGGDRKDGRTQQRTAHPRL